MVGRLYRYIRHTSILDFHGTGTNSHMKTVFVGYSGLQLRFMLIGHCYAVLSACTAGKEQKL
jgi:hypothetical protein